VGFVLKRPFVDVSSLCRPFFLFFGYEGKKGKKSEEENEVREGNCIETMARLRFKKRWLKKF
jgi:hypothetical protein